MTSAVTGQNPLERSSIPLEATPAKNSALRVTFLAITALAIVATALACCTAFFGWGGAALAITSLSVAAALALSALILGVLDYCKRPNVSVSPHETEESSTQEHVAESTSHGLDHSEASSISIGEITTLAEFLALSTNNEENAHETEESSTQERACLRSIPRSRSVDIFPRTAPKDDGTIRRSISLDTFLRTPARGTEASSSHHTLSTARVEEGPIPQTVPSPTIVATSEHGGDPLDTISSHSSGTWNQEIPKDPETTAHTSPNSDRIQQMVLETDLSLASYRNILDAVCNPVASTERSAEEKNPLSSRVHTEAIQQREASANNSDEEIEALNLKPRRALKSYQALLQGWNAESKNRTERHELSSTHRRKD